MSAFICSDMHINAIVSYAIDKRISFWSHQAGARVDITAHNGEEIGRMLMDENVRSVCARYEDAGNDEKSAGANYRFNRQHSPLTPVEIIKACHCLSYQSCETDDWDGTLAHTILQTIISHATHDLPGYDAAPWEINETTVDKLKHGRMTRLF